MKIKRFIKEYAKYQKDKIINHELMSEDVKEKAINNIDNIVKLSEKGLISVDESMRTIANILSEYTI